MWWEITAVSDRRHDLEHLDVTRFVIVKQFARQEQQRQNNELREERVACDLV